jgi:hypothetical protein
MNSIKLQEPWKSPGLDGTIAMPTDNALENFNLIGRINGTITYTFSSVAHVLIPGA